MFKPFYRLEWDDYDVYVRYFEKAHDNHNHKSPGISFAYNDGNELIPIENFAYYNDNIKEDLSNLDQIFDENPKAVKEISSYIKKIINEKEVKKSAGLDIKT